jgi:hypothetical protein
LAIRFSAWARQERAGRGRVDRPVDAGHIAGVMMFVAFNIASTFLQA